MRRKMAGILTVFLLILTCYPAAAHAAAPADKPLDEKTIVFLGDSITGSYEEKNTAAASIPYLVSQMTGAETYNCGFGSCAMTERLRSPYAYFSLPALARSIASGKFSAQEAAAAQVDILHGAEHVRTLKQINWNQVDVIVIGYGANDFTASVPISSRTNPLSLTTLQGALRYGIQTIQKRYPHIQFVLCSVHPRFDTSTENGGCVYTEVAPNNHGVTLADYAAAVQAVADTEGHLFADLYHTGITDENAAMYFPYGDGLHPALPGRLKAAQAIVKTLGGQALQFADVPVTSTHYESISWANRTGVASGVSDAEFPPQTYCTRAETLTYLWQSMGGAAPEMQAVFEDVSSDADYANAVSWAVEQGITQGTSEKEFSPDWTVSRAQAVTFLWRLAGCPVAEKAVMFTDTRPDGYYAQAVSWAVERGIANGYRDGSFAPAKECTRAQILTFLYRYIKAE